MQGTINMDVAEAICDLLKELASELDLHYEDEDFFALAPTIERMKTAAKIVEDSGYPLPDVYVHVLKRFHRHFN